MDAGGFKVLEEEMFLEGIKRVEIINQKSSWNAFGKQLETRMFKKKKNKREWEHSDFTEDGKTMSSIEIVSDKTKKKISLLEKRVTELEAVTDAMEARLRHLEITSPVTTTCKSLPSLPDLESGQEC